MESYAAGDEARAEAAFQAARRQARWGRWRRRLIRSCGDLVDAAPILAATRGRPRRSLGRQQVALRAIVGSTGRAHAFDRAYLPRLDDHERRWRSVARAMLSGTPLPPVRLLKSREVYLVEDGNHRISVARALGMETISAEVVELDQTPLIPNAACARSGFRVAGSEGGCGRAPV